MVMLNVGVLQMAKVKNGKLIGITRMSHRQYEYAPGGDLTAMMLMEQSGMGVVTTYTTQQVLCMWDGPPQGSSCARGGDPSVPEGAPTLPQSTEGSPTVTAQDGQGPEVDAIDVGEDGHSDKCGLCDGAGDLIMCDGCPRSFHPTCVELDPEALPEGDWQCIMCREQLANTQDSTPVSGRVVGYENVLLVGEAKRAHDSQVWSTLDMAQPFAAVGIGGAAAAPPLKVWPLTAWSVTDVHICTDQVDAKRAKKRAKKQKKAEEAREEEVRKPCRHDDMEFRLALGKDIKLMPPPLCLSVYEVKAA